MNKTIPSLLPLLPNRVWRTYPGGCTLDRMEGGTAPVDSHFPEDWLLSTTAAINRGREQFPDEGLTRTVVNGKEITLRELFAACREEMLGPAHIAGFGVQAGFLLKYLDSAVRLHIQCHPTRQFSRLHLGVDAGKTEGYIILGHRPDVEPYVFLGFQRAPDPAAFRQAVVTQDSAAILSSFDRLQVKAGDVFLVPGGLPHAIGEGVFMIEIMEPTDFAVRIEFERGGYVLPEAARFMGRDVDFAMSMFDYTPYSLDRVREEFFVKPLLLEEKPGVRRWSLFDSRYTDCFRAERITFDTGGEISLHHEGFRVIVVTAGCGMIMADGMELQLHPGDRLLVPHRTFTVSLNSVTGMEVIVARGAERFSSC